MAFKPEPSCARPKPCGSMSCEAPALRGPVVRGQKLGPFLVRGGGMARAVGVACKEKEMSKWPEILWDGWIGDVAFIAKLFLSGIWYDAEEEEEDQEGDDSRSSADGEDVDDSEDDYSECGEEVDYGNEE